MKKTFLIILLILLAAMCLANDVVGKIRFLVGEVQYKESQNLNYKTTLLNALVHKEGYFKTGPGSSVEIQWNNGSVSVINASTQVAVSKVMADAANNANWKNKMWDKVNNLKTQNRSAGTVAGIRRDEAEVKKESQLFWYQDALYDIQAGIDHYDKGEYTQAIPIFEGVIQQGPLKKDAEISRAYLIMIYDELGDKTKQKQQVDLLKADFPHSSMLESLPPEQ